MPPAGLAEAPSLPQAVLDVRLWPKFSGLKPQLAARPAEAPTAAKAVLCSPLAYQIVRKLEPKVFTAHATQKEPSVVKVIL